MFPSDCETACYDLWDHTYSHKVIQGFFRQYSQSGFTFGCHEGSEARVMTHRGLRVKASGNAAVSAVGQLPMVSCRKLLRLAKLSGSFVSLQYLTSRSCRLRNLPKLDGRLFNLQHLGMLSCWAAGGKLCSPTQCDRSNCCKLLRQPKSSHGIRKHLQVRRASCVRLLRLRKLSGRFCDRAAAQDQLFRAAAIVHKSCCCSNPALEGY